MRLILTVALVASTSAAMAQNAPSAAPATAARRTITHRGFTIDVSEVASAAGYDSVLKAVKEQLDIVANVTMPTGTRTIFRRVPIVMQKAQHYSKYTH
jgi:hypothetical protein